MASGRAALWWNQPAIYLHVQCIKSHEYWCSARRLQVHVTSIQAYSCMRAHHAVFLCCGLKYWRLSLGGTVSELWVNEVCKTEVKGAQHFHRSLLYLSWMLTHDTSNIIHTMIGMSTYRSNPLGIESMCLTPLSSTSLESPRGHGFSGRHGFEGAFWVTLVVQHQGSLSKGTLNMLTTMHRRLLYSTAPLSIASALNIAHGCISMCLFCNTRDQTVYCQWQSDEIWNLHVSYRKFSHDLMLHSLVSSKACTCHMSWWQSLFVSWLISASYSTSRLSIWTASILIYVFSMDVRHLEVSVVYKWFHSKTTRL